MNAWDGVPEFIAVVEAGGFTAAQSRVSGSVAHISRRVAQLEERLGAKLLQRSTRVVRLTEAGASYFKQVKTLAEQIEQVQQGASSEQEQMRGVIRITSGGRYAEDHVAPALASFVQRYPQIQLDIELSTRFVDLVAEGYDLGIRYGTLPDSSLIARRLSVFPTVCVASPDYWKRHGKPATPGELIDHNCLTLAGDPWVFVEQRGQVSIPIKGNWRANSGGAIIAPAIAGLGVAYLPRVIVQACIDSGALEPALEQFSDQTRSSWMVYPERHFVPTRVSKLMDYLVEWFGGVRPEQS